MRSIRENIRTEVFEVRTERSELYCVAIIKDQRPKPSLNSVLNLFVSPLNAAVGGEIFSSSRISFKVELSIKKLKLASKFLSSLLFLFIEEGLRFPSPIRLFGGPIRLWTDR